MIHYYPMVKYCLENNIIKSEQIKYGIKASLSIQPDHNEFITYLYGLLDNDIEVIG